MADISINNFGERTRRVRCRLQKLLEVKSIYYESWDCVGVYTYMCINVKSIKRRKRKEDRKEEFDTGGETPQPLGTHRNKRMRISVREEENCTSFQRSCRVTGEFPICNLKFSPALDSAAQRGRDKPENNGEPSFGQG